METNYLNELEQGAAAIRIELKGGFIRVYHTESGELLHKRLARKGDWASLWNELSKPERHNGVNILGAREIKSSLIKDALFLLGLFSLWYLLILIFA